jgi:uncharacterized protein (TIGR02646 family)
MRFIDLNDLVKDGQREPEEIEWPPNQWVRDARKAYEVIKNLPASERTSIAINKYSRIWGSLKKDFREISYQKCWYCESLIDVERGEMDHFRPKAGITGVPDHPGYWWLAFEWRNFRFSCSTCNSGNPDPEKRGREDAKGGKGNHFPLLHGEAQRIKVECTYDRHWREQPKLLDPTNPNDPGLLTFGLDGKPRPSRNNKIDYERAQESIRIYQLDHGAKNRRRRNDIYYAMKECVETLKRDKEEFKMDQTNFSLKANIESNILKLRRMIKPQAEYSAAANAFLKRYRYLSWIDEIITGPR